MISSTGVPARNSFVQKDRRLINLEWLITFKAIYETMYADEISTIQRIFLEQPM